MRTKKIILIMLCICSMTMVSKAQQNVQYTQFMYSKLWMNPAYAGSHDVSTIQAISRNQWIGIDGAPVSRSINFHTAMFGDRVGLGLSLNQDRIGPTNALFLNMSYAYRMRTAKGHKLAVGIQANITSYALRTNGLVASDAGDATVQMDNEKIVRPNFGIGVYYNSEKFFFGLSAPLIAKGDLAFNSNSDFTISTQEFHSYLMAGMIHKVKGDAIKGKPAILLKKVANAPFDLDLNYSLIFYDKLWVGASYRLGGDRGYGFGESIDVMFQYELSNGLRLGAAYDFTLSDLRTVNDGTIEIMAQYFITRDNSRLTNPRFF